MNKITLEKITNIRDQRNETMLVYLRAMEAELTENPLLDRFGRKLDDLRVPLRVVPNEPAREIEEIRDRRQFLQTVFTDDSDADQVAQRVWAFRGTILEEEKASAPTPERLDKLEPKLEMAVLLGDPGSGKTEWLKYRALLAVREGREKLETFEISLDDLCFPAYLRLRDVAETLVFVENEREKPDSALRDFLVETRCVPERPAALSDAKYAAAAILKALIEHHRLSPYLAPWVWRKLISQRQTDPKLLLCLDAWDEVHSGQNTLSRCLNAFAKETHARIFLTSRIIGYTQSPLPVENTIEGQRSELKLCPFGRRETESFVMTFFQDDPERGRRMLGGLRAKAAIAGAAQNPLIVTLMCMSFSPNPTLPPLTFPARRVEIYERAINGLLVEWEAIDKDEQPNSDLIEAKRRLLEEMAYHFFPDEWFSGARLHNFFWNEESGYMIKLDGVHPLKQMLKQKGTSIEGELCKDAVLVRYGGGFEFLHLTFQEYFTACAIAQRNDWLNIAKSKMWEEHWAEVSQLLAAKIYDYSPPEEDNVNRFFQTMLSLEDDIFNTILCRLAKCASECWDYIAEGIHEKIRDTLFSSWLGKVNYDAWMDESALRTLATVDRYLFNRLIDALEGEDDDIRKKAAELLGDIGNPDAVDALLKILDNYGRQYRGPETYVKSLGKIGDPRAIEPLAGIMLAHGLGGEHAAKALSEIGGKEVQQILLLLLALKCPQHLMALVESKYGEINRSYGLCIPAIYAALIQTGIEDIVEEVIDAITDSIGQLKPWLNKRLSTIAYPKFNGPFGTSISANQTWEKITEFEDILSNGTKQQKIDLLNNIVEMTGSDYMSFLGKCLTKWGDMREKAEQDEEQKYKKYVEEEIESVGSELVVAQNFINGLLSSNNEEYRGCYARALGMISNEEAIEGLKFALEDESAKVRLVAAKSLIKIGGEQACEVLAGLLESEEDVAFKKDIIKTLAENHIKQAKEILIKTLESDSEGSIRLEAAKALESIGYSMEEPRLFQMLEDENDEIKRYSVQSLGKRGGPQVIDALYQRLKVENKSYIWEGLRSACRKDKIRLFPDGRILEGK